MIDRFRYNKSDIYYMYIFILLIYFINLHFILDPFIILFINFHLLFIILVPFINFHLLIYNLF